jgi:hypothetical protein
VKSKAGLVRELVEGGPVIDALQDILVQEPFVVHAELVGQVPLHLSRSPANTLCACLNMSEKYFI